MAKWELRTPTITAQINRYRRAPRVAADVIEKNLISLGHVVMAKERAVLAVMQYTGATVRSIATEYMANPPYYKISIGPLVGDRKVPIYILLGTKPHIAPTGPIKAWARWKLGDERLWYPVWKSIQLHGTSVHIERLGLGDGHGGYNYVRRTLEHGVVQNAVNRFRQRVPLDIKTYLEGGT